MNDLGTIEQSFSIRLQRDLNHSSERIWKALTDARQVTTWMEYPSKLEPIVGKRVYIDFSPEEPLEGIVVQARRHSLLAYTWGNSVVTWTLMEHDDCVRLEFCHHHVEPKFAVGLAAGWHCFIDNLEAHLAGAAFGDRFEELSEKYARQIDP